jgi:16S rRNA (guanine527-N7)-methyltransferase
VTARALASLPVLVEYAAPLLEVGGHLVAWKGKPEPSEDADGRAAAATLGMSAPESVEVAPLTRALSRRLYVSSKVMATPAGYPRRPGMARKRPLRASG